MLDAVVDYMPAPTEVHAIKGEYEDGRECVVDSTDDGEFAALVEAAKAVRIWSWVSPHLPKIELPKEELMLDPAPELDP